MIEKYVLVVEDNQMNTQLVTDLLEAAGFSVIHAPTAEEGIHAAREKQPDLILMDVSLPGMDGLCAVRTLKSSAATCKIPVLALTAHAMNGDEKNALEAGCNGYLSKPINTRTFVATVTTYLAPQIPAGKELYNL